MFRSGDHARYMEMIAAAADRASEGAASIAFAQASMAPAGALCKEARPLNSPRASLESAAHPGV
jgi:hypothetical protein